MDGPGINLVFVRPWLCSLEDVGRKKKTFNDVPFPYHAEIELEIATLTNLGLGLGRVSLEPPGAAAVPVSGEASLASWPAAGDPPPVPRGWVVMVPFALPGERVRVRVFRNHKNFSEADLLEVLTPSPERITAPCPLFGRCGGCQYQHLHYSAQLHWKRQQVQELLLHLAGLQFPVATVIPSPRDYGYRSKITPHFAAPDRRPRPDSGPSAEATETPVAPAAGEPSFPIGFLRQGSRFELIDVPQCPIATPEINAKLTELRIATRRRLAAGEYQRGATLLLRQAQEGVVTDYDAIIHELVTPAPTPASDGAPPGTLRLHFLARDFFQNNPFILPAFTGYVRDEAARSGARYLVDAYCGSGLFALSAASAFESVTGIEISESSVRFARENAEANGITNATFHAGQAAAIFAGLPFPSAETVVVIDPPRKGCDEDFLRQLFAFGPRAVVYVSCDPATQMRDLVQFNQSGYRLTAVQPFDLFPQTRHLECVVTLVRESA
jgi:tRNA/tmRNA/rRNA uracil-C5-methylase (TrmA/RlmC/RlmD family)